MKDTGTDGLYSIFDTVAEEFGQIFQCRTDAIAIRATRNLLKNVYSSKDYILFQMGIWNREKMLIETMAPRVISFAEGAEKMEEEG